MKNAALAALLFAAVTPAQVPSSAVPAIQASLAPEVGVVVSGEVATLVLRVEFRADTSVDLAVLGGVHLETKYADADSGVIGKPARRNSDVAGGTVIERRLEIELPVETAAEVKRVSVVWPGLPGAVTSLKVVPEQASIDVDKLDLAKTEVMLVTNFGTLTLGFFPDKAPNHAANFVKLAKSGFYDGTQFHRVIKGFMIQGGCPNTKEGATGRPGSGDPGYKIDAELSDIRHKRGIVSMARGADINSAGCQFFICHGTANFLDDKYSAFGELKKGFDALDRIAEVPVRRQGQSAVPLEPVYLYKAIVLPAWKP